MFKSAKNSHQNNQMQTLLHSLPPLLHQSLPPHPPTPLLKGLHGSKGEQQQQQQQRMQTLLQQAAAMSLITSQKQHTPPPPAPLSAKEFWGEATCLRARDRFGEWVKIAELVMVMVPGSVEDERMFSTLRYIRNPQCNRLYEKHLTSCAWGFKSSAFRVESFPYPQAILE